MHSPASHHCKHALPLAYRDPTSADFLSMRMFWEWRSPSPMRYPAMELTAVARVYVRRLSNQVPGCRKFSRKKLCRQGVKHKHAYTVIT